MSGQTSVPGLATLESYQPQVKSLLDVILSTAVATTILDATETGILLGLAFRVVVVSTGTTGFSFLEVAVDNGAFVQFLQCYNGTDVFDNSLTPFAIVGTGSTIGDRVVVPCSFRYNTRIQVRLNKTVAATLGTLRVEVLRALKL